MEYLTLHNAFLQVQIPEIPGSLRGDAPQRARGWPLASAERAENTSHGGMERGRECIVMHGSFPLVCALGNACYYDLSSQLWSRGLSIDGFLAPLVIKGDEEPCAELA